MGVEAVAPVGAEAEHPPDAAAGGVAIGTMQAPVGLHTAGDTQSAAKAHALWHCPPLHT